MEAKSTQFLTREQASDYISNTYGLRVAVKTLSKLASVGGGPLYRKFGRAAVYRVEELDAWIAEKLSEPRRAA